LFRSVKSRRIHCYRLHVRGKCCVERGCWLQRRLENSLHLGWSDRLGRLIRGRSFEHTTRGLQIELCSWQLRNVHSSGLLERARAQPIAVVAHFHELFTRDLLERAQAPPKAADLFFILSLETQMIAHIFDREGFAVSAGCAHCADQFFVAIHNVLPPLPSDS
jgi:hypothetical protein